MANIPVKSRAEQIKDMFTHIAPHYDRANRWMTWGQDVQWRRQVIQLAGLPVGGRLLDVGTGTGDLALECIRLDRSATVIGMDFTEEMMRLGRSRVGVERISWINADALVIPFKSGSFDAVVSGYLLRNVTDITQALSEQFRVLKKGGRMVSLDTTPLPADIWHVPARFYLRHIIPIIGRLVAGDGSAYQYLPLSTRQFLPAEQLALRMGEVGFKQVRFRRLMGGTMAIHSGIR